MEMESIVKRSAATGTDLERVGRYGCSLIMECEKKGEKMVWFDLRLLIGFIFLPLNMARHHVKKIVRCYHCHLIPLNKNCIPILPLYHTINF